MRAALRHPAAWWVLLLIGLMPLAWLVWQTLHDQLGANPAEALIRATGDWTLRGLCVVLAVTPLRTWLGWPELAGFGACWACWCFSTPACTC
jgi:methionine sulfoxide reductase heme-binding subunit